MPTEKWKKPVFSSMRGLDHIRCGTECQDYVEVVDRTEYTIAVLADGIGSKPLSEYAAAEAVNGTIYWFMAHAEELGGAEDPKDGIKRIAGLLPELRWRIRDMAIAKDLDVDQMDCNLAFVFLRKDPGGKDRAYYGVLGDCAVCVIRSRDQMETKCGASEGGIATDSVMHEGSANNFHLYCSDVQQEDIHGFLLTTDGLEYVAYVKRSPYVYQGAQDFYNAIFDEDPKRRIDGLFRKLQGNPSFSDDLSIAVLSRDDKPRTFRKDPQWLCKCGHRNPIYAMVCGNCKTDYLKLYNGLEKDFDTYRCKDAFECFLYLNQHPDQELLQIGKPPVGLLSQNIKNDKPSPARTQQKKAESHKKEDHKQNAPEENMIQPPASPANVQRTSSSEAGEGEKPHPRRRSPLFLYLSFALVVVLMLANLIFSTINLRNGYAIREMRKDLSVQLQEVQVTLEDIIGRMDTPGDVTETESFRVELEDGSVYYGPVRNGVPHGYGMVQQEEQYAYGEMIHGKKNGIFWIRNTEDPDILSVVLYISGEQSGEPVLVGQVTGRTDMLTGCVTTSEVTVYADCDPDAQILNVLDEGTLVYLTGKYESTSRSTWGRTELWLELCTTDGVVCWCKASALGLYGL